MYLFAPQITSQVSFRRAPAHIQPNAYLKSNISCDCEQMSIPSNGIESRHNKATRAPRRIVSRGLDVIRALFNAVKCG